MPSISPYSVNPARQRVRKNPALSHCRKYLYAELALPNRSLGRSFHRHPVLRTKTIPSNTRREGIALRPPPSFLWKIRPLLVPSSEQRVPHASRIRRIFPRPDLCRTHLRALKCSIAGELNDPKPRRAHGCVPKHDTVCMENSDKTRLTLSTTRACFHAPQQIWPLLGSPVITEESPIPTNRKKPPVFACCHSTYRVTSRTSTDPVQLSIVAISRQFQTKAPN
jgi:hypothetical protein